MGEEIDQAAEQLTSWLQASPEYVEAQARLERQAHVCHQLREQLQQTRHTLAEVITRMGLLTPATNEALLDLASAVAWRRRTLRIPR